MSVRQANCPSCGGQISFRPGTTVSVCTYCTSIVARTDRDLSLLGKASDLVDTHSPLWVGAMGTWQQTHFTVAGRTQLSHAAGGVWDEWYLAFDDGRWGWLASAQGNWYLTFQSESRAVLPRFEECRPGMSVNLGTGGNWVVQEVGQATVRTAEGELPYSYKPNETYSYADITGPRDAFATLDFSEDPPTFFLGRQISLDDLTVPGVSDLPRGESIHTATLNCPHCAGPLELRAPDSSLRVTCPSCNSLLDVSSGKLAYLSTLPGERFQIAIPLGTEGTLEGIRWTVIGWMRRSTIVDSIEYPWEEYLLYHAKSGFAWLVCSEDHWSFLKPVPLADIKMDGRWAWHKKIRYRKFQENPVTVKSVRGEFYWRVNAGERSQSTDYVAPPGMLSIESSQSKDAANQSTAKEVNATCGTYLAPKEVWKAFELPGSPPKPRKIAPNQPSPHKTAGLRAGKAALLFMALLLILWIIRGSLAGEHVIYDNLYSTPFPTDDAGAAAIFTDSFEVTDPNHILKVEVQSPVQNSWIYLDGALINEELGDIVEFSSEVAFYSGTDSDGSWTEGSQKDTTYLSAVPKGTYLMRLAPQVDPKATGAGFRIVVYQGATRTAYFVISLVFALLVPAILFGLHFNFEHQRWQESNFNPRS